jgi:hypothetical protein
LFPARSEWDDSKIAHAFLAVNREICCRKLIADPDPLDERQLLGHGGTLCDCAAEKPHYFFPLVANLLRAKAARGFACDGFVRQRKADDAHGVGAHDTPHGVGYGL